MTQYATRLQRLGLALLLLGLATPLKGDSVYRCEQDGRILFSDQPCESGAEPELIRPQSRGLQIGPKSGEKAPAPDDVPPSSDPDEHAEEPMTSPCRDFTSTERRRLRVRGELVPGMTREDVRESLGRPAEQYQEPRELWIYVQRSRGYQVGETRIYFRDGCVERVQ